MLNKSPLTAVVLVGVVASLVACDSTLKWQDYVSEAGGYTISMPGAAKEKTRRVPIPGGKELDLKLADVELSDAAYLVSYLDYPGNLLGTVDAQQLLSQSLQGAVKNSIQGEIVQEEATTVNDVPCRKFQAKGTVKEKDASAQGIFCLQKSRLYQVLAIGEAKDDFATNANQFLTSFQINKPGA
jgi:hypothetical protein